MESEHNEVDGMKKGVDSKGEVMHRHFNNILILILLLIILHININQHFNNIPLHR